MRLKEIRQFRNLTQAEVAEMLHCATNVYGRYEQGLRQPSIDILLAMAEVFHVSVDYLLEKDTTSEDILTDEELHIIAMFRAADQRAVEDALVLLQTHRRE